MSNPYFVFNNAKMRQKDFVCENPRNQNDRGYWRFLLKLSTQVTKKKNIRCNKIPLAIKSFS